MIISSTLRIYENDTLIDTVPIVGDVTEGTTSALAPGSEYNATVESVNEEQLSSGESPAYKFYSLPNITLTGYVNRDGQGFTRPTTITTDVVAVTEHGLEYDTTSSFDTPQRVIGNIVNNLQENTTYYYRPWLRDEFNRVYVNTSDTDSVTTLYALPVIDWIAIYGADVSTFSALINITSLDSLTAVVAELTTSGATTTQSLTAQTGNQYVTITGLTPNTQYTITISATNSAGIGQSYTETFTTLPASQGMTVTLVRPVVSNVDNELSATSVASYNPGEISLVSHSIELYQNEYHTGIPVDTDTDTTDSLTSTFTGLSEDTTYWVFGKVEYTVGSDVTVLEAWSEPEQIQTYALLSFGTITSSSDQCSIAFTVSGSSSNTQVEYSVDQVNWINIPINNPQGETLTITNLAPSTNYYLRGRVQSQAGWQEYVEDTFTTTGAQPTVLITGISNVTSNSAVVAIQINQ